MPGPLLPVYFWIESAAPVCVPHAASVYWHHLHLPEPDGQRPTRCTLAGSPAYFPSVHTACSLLGAGMLQHPDGSTRAQDCPCPHRPDPSLVDIHFALRPVEVPDDRSDRLDA